MTKFIVYELIRPTLRVDLCMVCATKAAVGIVSKEQLGLPIDETPEITTRVENSRDELYPKCFVCKNYINR